MRALKFCGLSLIYAAVSIFIWAEIRMKCGMGPDSPLACNERADLQASIFLAVALIAYALFTMFYWRRRRTGAR